MTLNNKCNYSDVALLDVTIKMQCWGVVMLSNVVLSVVMLSAVTPLFTVVNNSFVQ